MSLWGAFSFKLPHQRYLDLLICLPQALKSSSLLLLSPHSFTVPGSLWVSLVLGRCLMPIPEGENRERVPDLSAQYCSTEAGLAICSAIDRSWPSVFTPLISQLRSSTKSHGTYRKCMKQLYFVWDVFKMFGDTISHSYLGICPNHLFKLSIELSVLVSLYLLMISADVYLQTLL